MATEQQVHVLEPDGWKQVDLAADQTAEALSRARAGTVVQLDLHSAEDLIWIRCWVRGTLERELLYSSDDGWKVSGTPQPFEKPSLQQFLSRRKLLATPDGYDVLDSFMGDLPPVPAAGRAPVQAVGRTCARCAQPITTAPEGVGCTACQKAFHLRCLPDPKSCPECRELFLLQQLVIQLDEARVERRAALLGLIPIAIVLLLVIAFVVRIWLL